MFYFSYFNYFCTMKILMVCLGNICRSPLADGLLAQKIMNENLNHNVDSAGTCDHHIGQSPDARMTKTAENFGLSLSHLRAREFTAADFDEFDRVYAMDKSNYQNIISLSRNQSDINKVRMILDENHPNQDMEVPDPYYGGKEGFLNVYSMLDEATDCIMNELRIK